LGVRTERLTEDAPFLAEIRTAFALHRRLAGRVRAAREAGAFPLVVSGNCNSALGTIAGVGPFDPGIIWFDGHLDARTPESTTTGSLDGMGVATATGRCWTTLAATIPGFAPVAPERMLYVGSRHLDPDLAGWITDSGVAMIAADSVRRVGVEAAATPALDALRAWVRRVYLHVDLDVLDPVPAPANELAPPDGLTIEQVEEAIRLIGKRFAIAAAEIASYDPALDRHDRPGPRSARCRALRRRPRGGHRRGYRLCLRIRRVVPLSTPLVANGWFGKRAILTVSVRGFGTNPPAGRVDVGGDVDL
jgi:arginase